MKIGLFKVFAMRNDDGYITETLAVQSTDFHEISQEDFVVLRDHLYDLNKKNTEFKYTVVHECNREELSNVLTECVEIARKEAARRRKHQEAEEKKQRDYEAKKKAQKEARERKKLEELKAKYKDGK